VKFGIRLRSLALYNLPLPAKFPSHIATKHQSLFLPVPIILPSPTLSLNLLMKRRRSHHFCVSCLPTAARRQALGAPRYRRVRLAAAQLRRQGLHGRADEGHQGFRSSNLRGKAAFVARENSISHVEGRVCRFRHGCLLMSSVLLQGDACGEDCSGTLPVD